MGVGESDSNRYLLVRHNYVARQFTTPKSNKTRRVDLSRQLRSVLLELRDRRMFLAFTEGKSSILDEFVFPPPRVLCSTPTISSSAIFCHQSNTRDLGGFRFHDLRHTFGSLLIQGGASVTYVKEQMGHSSIQVTVDTYGHLIPGANVNWVDRLDVGSSPQQTATNPTTSRPASAGPDSCRTH